MDEIENDGFGNWCPDCGEPRGVCRCAELPYVDYEDLLAIEQAEYDKLICPQCESTDTVWVGGDSVVNLSGPMLTRVDFYTCQSCGHKWTFSE